MEVLKRGNLRTWKTKCPKCLSSLKYTKADGEKRYSRNPAGKYTKSIASRVEYDVITCPVCATEIPVYFNNECTPEEYAEQGVTI